MKINFPPGWGKNQTDPILVPYEDLDDFIEAVREAGFDMYRGLKNWAGFSSSYLYIYDGTLHGSKSTLGTEGTAYNLDDIVIHKDESIQEILSLL